MIVLVYDPMRGSYSMDIFVFALEDGTELAVVGNNGKIIVLDGESVEHKNVRIARVKTSRGKMSWKSYVSIALQGMGNNLLLDANGEPCALLQASATFISRSPIVRVDLVTANT